VYVNLGRLSLGGGNFAEAAEFFGEALTLDPADETATRGITDARARASGR
jgi:uncharacterized protein HemY